jgi:hypothetical protein
MRLHEFTNPTKYLLAEADAADPVKQTKSIETDDSADTANCLLNKKPETKKPSDIL